MNRLAVVALLGTTGCKSDNEVVRRSQLDTFYQSATDMVDILWVIDNSLSMSDEQAEVASKFGEFIESIEATGLDFHVGVITTDMESTEIGRGQLLGDPTYLTRDDDDYIAAFQDRIQVGIQGSDREKGLDAAITALTEPIVSSSNAGFLRDGAVLSIIFVSDENDCTDRGALDGYDEATACYEYSEDLVPIFDLIEEYDAIKPDEDRTLISAIVGPEITENCGGAVPGFRYQTMADAFGGITGNICQSSFSDIMERLGLQASGMLSSFQLTYFAVEDTLEVYINDTSVPGEQVELDGETWVQISEDTTNGWSYDETYALIYFHGDAVPPREATIKVDYEVIPGSLSNID
ncbi:MAG: hypothetical protein P8R54_08815 [Myxococcota bacterium]|nr:hypothetical protein [Myxococcota bacterium]